MEAKGNDAIFRLLSYEMPGHGVKNEGKISTATANCHCAVHIDWQATLRAEA